MEKPILSIHDFSIKEFGEFKANYLERGVLSEEAIGKIKKLFKIGESDIARICCDEYHAHSFKCIVYNSPEAGIVERLINEIHHYRSILKSIHTKTDLDKIIS